MLQGNYRYRSEIYSLSQVLTPKGPTGLNTKKVY